MKTSIKTTRSNVFTNAWKLVKTFGISISEALKSAWSKIKNNNTFILEVVKNNISKISDKFSYSEKFKKSFHSKKTSLWEKEGNARLYVARDAYSSAGYINLVTGELVAERAGTMSDLNTVMNYIKSL